MMVGSSSSDGLDEIRYERNDKLGGDEYQDAHDLRREHRSRYNLAYRAYLISDKVGGLVVRAKHNRHNDDEELCESRRPAAPPRCDLT